MLYKEGIAIGCFTDGGADTWILDLQGCNVEVLQNRHFIIWLLKKSQTGKKRR